MMQSKKIKKISIIIPVYNEQDNIILLIKRITHTCSTLHIKYEIIFVDDGSNDDSSKILELEASKLNKSIIVIFLNRNYGQHAAIMAGFLYAHGDLVITLDADLQNPPEEIPNLLHAAQKGYDVIGTFRINRQDNLFRKVSSRVVNYLIKKILGNNMTDYGCMLRAYRRHIIDKIINYNSRNIFIPIVANMFTRSIIEIPVMHFKRKFGNSRYTYIKLIQLIYNLFACLLVSITKKIKIFKKIRFKLILFILFVVIFIYYFSLQIKKYINSIILIFLCLIGMKKFFFKIYKNTFYKIYKKIYLRPMYVINRIIKKK
ncbi:MAG: glycosyltransferase [Wigglesworthia glossinidia]|nr:glycosyltransferase [Wigglesworthia glossinidia]